MTMTLIMAWATGRRGGGAGAVRGRRGSRGARNVISSDVTLSAPRERRATDVTRGAQLLCRDAYRGTGGGQRGGGAEHAPALRDDVRLCGCCIARRAAWCGSRSRARGCPTGPPPQRCKRRTTAVAISFLAAGESAKYSSALCCVRYPPPPRTTKATATRRWFCISVTTFPSSPLDSPPRPPPPGHEKNPPP